MILFYVVLFPICILHVCIYIYTMYMSLGPNWLKGVFNDYVP